MSDFYADSENAIKIISVPSEQNPFAVIYKPGGMPSAPLAQKTSGAKSALEYAAEIFPEIISVTGKLPHEHGLLHRLDTAASGILLLATTQASYDWLYDCQKQGDFEKSYRAQCIFFPENIEMLDGFPPFEKKIEPEKKLSFTASSAFRAYGKGNKAVRPVTSLSGKAAQKKSAATEYTTQIEIQRQVNGQNVFEAVCTITKGFRHQVRCHLAWSGFPVIGDALYNANKNIRTPELKFTAFRFSFLHPISKVKVTIEI